MHGPYMNQSNINILKDVKRTIDSLLQIIMDKEGVPVRDVFNPSIKYQIKTYPNLNNAINKANEIWFGADWHLWKKGNFQNPSKDELINNQMSMVKSNDIYIMLGDMVHRDTYESDVESKLKTIIGKLKGTKVLVLGNHDIFDKQYYLNAGFDYVNEGFLWDKFAVTHVPLHHSAYQGAEYNIHGHTHGWNGERRVPFKNHVCVYSGMYDNKPITLSDLMLRFERYKRTNPS